MDLQPGFSKAKCECIYSQFFSKTKWHNASTANFSKAKWPNTSTDDSVYLQPISSNAKWLHASTTIFFSNAKWLNTSTANFHVFFKSWVAQCIYNLFFVNAKSTCSSIYPIMYWLTYLLIYLVHLIIHFFAYIHLLNYLITYLFIIHWYSPIDAIGVRFLSFCQDAISVRFLSSKNQHKINVMKKNRCDLRFFVSV